MLHLLLFVVLAIILIGSIWLSLRWSSIKEIEGHAWNRYAAAHLIVDADRSFQSNFGEGIQSDDIARFKHEDRWLRQRAAAPTRHFGDTPLKYDLPDTEERAMRLVVEEDYYQAALENAHRPARSMTDQPLG